MPQLSHIVADLRFLFNKKLFILSDKISDKTVVLFMFVTKYTKFLNL